MWRASRLDADDIRRMRRVREQHDLRPLAIHDCYLINLASANPVVRERSIGAFRGELQRARAIGAEYVVAHPGSYRGLSPEQGIERFARGLARAARRFRPGGLMLLIEGTAGSGSTLGASFEELRALRDRAVELTDLPIGYCLDTCHLLAAGFDIASAAGLRRTLREADRVLGLDNVRLIHANDSKAPRGSRVDRHANIGEGFIGRDGFRRILAHPVLRRLPFILETPVEQEDDDRRNLETLKQLCPLPSRPRRVRLVV